MEVLTSTRAVHGPAYRPDIVYFNCTHADVRLLTAVLQAAQTRPATPAAQRTLADLLAQLGPAPAHPPLTWTAVSYTHLTLPTILRV